MTTCLSQAARLHVEASAQIAGFLPPSRLLQLLRVVVAAPNSTREVALAAADVNASVYNYSQVGLCAPSQS